MRASNIRKAIDDSYVLNRPLLISGPPGVGKSSLVKQYASTINVPVLDWRLTLMDTVDMRGTPVQKNMVTQWAPPAELPTKGSGILFLDELPQARIDVKNVAAMLVLERRIGEYQLPPDWRIMAAGNRASDNAGTTPMPQHLNNRFWHIEFDLSQEDWLAWADANDIDYRVYAYVKYKPAALFDFDPRSKDPAFASPRSWELCSDLIKRLDSSGSMMTSIEPALRAEYFSGAVGKLRGTEFSGFLQVMHDLVSIDDVYADPKNAPVPTDPSTTYALTVALVVNAKRETLAAALQYIGRLPREFSMVAMYAIEKRNPALQKSKAYVELCAANQKSL